MKLDDRDIQILACLEVDAWLSYSELGAKVNLSASATQRRVERLLRDGIISGASARIAPDALGRPLRLYVLVELANDRSDTVNRFSRALARHPEIVEAHYLAGTADIVIVMQVSNMAKYAEFAARRLNDNPDVGRYRTMTSLRRLR